MNPIPTALLICLLPLPALSAVPAPRLMGTLTTAEWCPTGLAWSLCCTGPGKTLEVFYSVAIVPGAGSVAVGYETPAGPRRDRDWLIARTGADGALMWATSYDDPAHRDNVAQGVSADAAGNFAVAGWEDRADLGQYANWVVRKYDPTGRLLWSAGHDGPVRGDDRAQAVALDERGGVVAAGWQTLPGGATAMLVRRYDPAGRLVWSRSVPGGLGSLARAVAVGHEGDVFVAGAVSLGGFDRNWVVRRYDQTGKLLWGRVSGGPGWDEAHAISHMPMGGVVVAGKEQAGGPGSAFRWLVNRYDSAGNIMWSRTYSSPEGGDAKAFAVSADSCGRIVVAGCEGGDPATSAGRGLWRVLMLDDKGGIDCSISGTGVATSGSCAMAAALDDTGAAVVAGFQTPPDTSEPSPQVRVRGRDMDAVLAGYRFPACTAPVRDKPAADPVRRGSAVKKGR